MAGTSPVFVLRLSHKDGTIEHIAKLDESDPRQEELLDEAMDEVERRFQGEATLTVHYAKDLFSAGVADPASVQDWNDLRKQWNLDS